MTSRRKGSLLALALAAACMRPQPAAAKHYNLGAFVPAYVPCTQATANTQTTNGVPACAPAVPLSNCDTDPDTALKLSPKLRSAFTYRNTGRRETVANGRVVDVLTRVVVEGVQTCDSRPFTGRLEVQATARMVDTSDACVTGECVRPDFSWKHGIDCVDGKCSLARSSANATFAEQGRPLLPSHRPYAMRFSRFAILDRAGRVVATSGLQMGRPETERRTAMIDSESWIRRLLDPFGIFDATERGRWLAPRSAYAYEQTAPGTAQRLLARYTQAYPECSVENTDAVMDGGPVCTGVPLSNCAIDPDNAVVAVVPDHEHTREGRGKFHLRLQGQSLRIAGQVVGLHDCGGRLLNGSLQLRGIAQVTLSDPACGAEPCTTVDVAFFETPLRIVDGGVPESATLPLSSLGPFPGPATYATFDVSKLQLLDRAGNVALEGPSTFVRCNPHDPGTDPFCYGN